MPNVTDYVTWRGDLTFEERPFNEIDNLVLCQIAYIDMRSVFPEGEIIAVSDVIHALLEQNKLETLVADGVQKREEYTEFAAAVADSKRFGRLLMSNYVDILDQKQQIQFSAVTFRLDKHTAFAAFRGTDDTLVGWKEDFMLSFERIPAQEQALSYLQNTMDLSLSYYIGGHSKGANLALYAACLLPDAQRKRVLHVYANDGPGLCPDVMDTELIRNVDAITTKIVPEYDVIGKIFEMPVTDNRIVKSSGTGILQHGILTWQVNADGLMLVPDNAPGSIWIGQVMDQWIGGVSNVEDRKIFIDDLFDALSAGGVDTFYEMTALGPEGFERILSVVSKVSPVTLDVASALPVAAVTGQSADKSLGRKVSELFRESVLVRAFILLGGGAGCILLPGGMLPLTLAVLMAAFVALEIVFTIKRFRQLKGDMKAMQVQTYICMASIAVYLMILIKDNALMLISNAVFGLIFLFLAYHITDRAKSITGRDRRWYWSVLEAGIFTVMGVFVLIAPESTIQTFTFCAGIVFVIDGIVHLASAIRQKKQK